MTPEMWTAQAVAEIEGQSVEPAQAIPPVAPSTETTTEIAPLIQKVADSSIAEIEKLLGHLQRSRDSLRSEGERIQRETANYLAFSQMASASIKIISDTVQEWGRAGYPVQGQPKPSPSGDVASEAVTTTTANVETLNETAKKSVQDTQLPPTSRKDGWYSRRSKES
jgi:hypothetical protein